jgi:hypothetical protein
VEFQHEKCPARFRGCFKSINCERSCPEQPPKSPILGDFELFLNSKSSRMGDLGGECKALRYFSNILLAKLQESEEESNE